MNKLTKAQIVAMLEQNDKWVARALVVLHERQTSSEQSSEVTINRNNRGFRPCHARMGSSMAKFFTKRGYLTPKQIAYWRARDKQGNMRIGIYAGQLLEQSEIKSATNPNPVPVKASSAPGESDAFAHKTALAKKEAAEEKRRMARKLLRDSE